MLLLLVLLLVVLVLLLLLFIIVVIIIIIIIIIISMRFSCTRSLQSALTPNRPNTWLGWSSSGSCLDDSWKPRCPSCSVTSFPGFQVFGARSASTIATDSSRHWQKITRCGFTCPRSCSSSLMSFRLQSSERFRRWFTLYLTKWNKDNSGWCWVAWCLGSFGHAGPICILGCQHGGQLLVVGTVVFETCSCRNLWSDLWGSKVGEWVGGWSNGGRERTKISHKL